MILHRYQCIRLLEPCTIFPMLTRRDALRGLAAAPLALAQPSRKPNLVILFADDMGYGDISCYGSPDVPTPHIDALARQGARFTDGYVSAAVCSPSRVALLTGRHQQRFGHEFNSGPPEREGQVNFGLPKNATILPQMLKPHGYRSAIFGKWHLGVRDGYHPLQRGFDEFVGFLPGGNDFVTRRTPGAQIAAVRGEGERMPEQRQHTLLRGHTPFQDDRYLTDLLAEEGVEFIQRNRANQFFLYLSFNAIHTPLQATARYMDRFPTIKNPKHRVLAAMTAALDDAVGAVMAKLRESNLDRDTMVVFMSDNGCPVITGAGTNHPLNGEKVTYFEGGIRVPYVLRWPGRVPSGLTYRQPAVSRDIVPTFLEAAGISAPDGIRFDGANLLPYLNGRAGAPHQALFWRAGNGRAVRMGKWKLVEFGDSYSRLFDLEKDIGEKNDLSASHPAEVRKLRDGWKAWSDTMATPAWPARYRELTVNGETLTWEL